MAAKKTMTKDPDAAVEAQEYKPTEEKTSGWQDWEVRDALRTLSQAAKIRRNKALMAAIRKEAQQQVKVAQNTAKSL